MGFPTAPSRSKAQWTHLYATLPLSFEANRGQTDPSVRFLSRGQGYALFLTGREAVLTLKPSVVGGRLPVITKAGLRTTDNGPGTTDAVLRMQLLGANTNAQATGAEELPGKANYFLGNNPSKWRTNVPTYAKVRYEGVYPGVDLVYYGTREGKLEYDFVVAPGADPQAIALRFETPGHNPLKVNPQGDLVVALPSGNVQFHKPVVYQTASDSLQRTPDPGPRTPIEGHYALDAQNNVHFELGPYDHNRPLVIDPVLIYATYIGGSGGDIGYSIAVDSNDDAYICGVTNSNDFPTKGAEQGANKGNGDAFVTKINNAGTQLIYSTYFGGSGTDTATALAVSSGVVYLTGYTSSVNFPTQAPAGVGTTNPFQVSYGGGATDAFVAQFDATGSILVYSSYLGGSGADYGQGIAVDSAGNAYVTGSTQSSNFPTMNALQPSNAGGEDAFVTKVNVTGEQILYSTYLGGTQADVAQSIQLDGANNMYITGYTFSPNFPLASPLQSTIGGGADAFVCELNAAGTALTFSTFLGGSGDDRAYGLALDGSKNVYVTGATSSTNFPTTGGSFQPSLHGSSNAFVSKLNPAGSSLLYSTFLGGTGVDQGNSIAVIPSGTNAGVVYVTGFTESADFPTYNPIQSVLGLSNNNLCGQSPCADAFLTEFTADGTAVTFSTYLGGNGPDFGQSIALDSTPDPYITGSTSSTNFPTDSPSVPGTTYVPPYNSALTGTAGNAFIAKLDSGNGPNISLVPSKLNFGNETISVASALQPVTIFNPSTAPLVITQIQVGLVGLSTTVFTESDNCVGTINPGSFCTMNVVFTPNIVGSVSDQITITDNAGNAAGTEQTVNVTGAGVTAATAVTVAPTSLSFSSQNVGTISPPQSVTITNTGTQVLNITHIAISPSTDFQETDTCGTLDYTLSVGQSCTASVTFSPSASGNRTAGLEFSDNATGSPQTVLLTGIGAAEFSLSLAAATTACPNPTLIGNTQTCFNIVANGPTSFPGAITLACSTGTTCQFLTNPVFVGGNSKLIVSNLTTSMANPYAFQVTGTSGTQTTSLQVNLGFEDFVLTATPSSEVIQSGTNAKYTILINPLNGFDNQIQLAFYQASPSLADATYTWSNSQPTPNGPTQVTLSIATVKYVPTTTHIFPGFPKGKLPPLIFGLLCLAGLASLALGNKRRGRQGWLGSGWLGLRLATLSLILALNLAMAACRSSVLVISGTATGNYVITIQGTLLANTAVVRYCTLDLSTTTTAP